MPTTTRTRPPTPDASAGRGPRNTQVFDLEPPEPKRKARMPEIALGVLLIAGFGMAALWFQLSSSATTAVIALAVDVERGEVIELSDLQLVFVRTDDQLNVLGEHDSGAVVGRVALSDLSAGTLITAEQVGGGVVVDAGQGVVGLALGPGDYPSLTLGAGDPVAVVLTPAASGAEALVGGRDTLLDRADGQVLVERALVVEVAPIGDQGDVFASVAMGETEAALVAQAAALDRVRLIEVSSDGTGDGEGDGG